MFFEEVKWPMEMDVLKENKPQCPELDEELQKKSINPLKCVFSFWQAFKKHFLSKANKGFVDYGEELVEGITGAETADSF